MSHFNVSLIVWAKSRDSVHKPQFLKRRERRAEADRTEALLIVYQPSALPLGHTGSQNRLLALLKLIVTARAGHRSQHSVRPVSTLARTAELVRPSPVKAAKKLKSREKNRQGRKGDNLHGFMGAIF